MNTSGFAKQRVLSITLVCFIILLFACSPHQNIMTTPTLKVSVTKTNIPTDTPVPIDTATSTATIQPSSTPTTAIHLTETAIANKCVATPAGLIGWWAGNGNAHDLFAGNDGVLNGGVSYAIGKVGQAFSFNGIDGSVDIPRSPILDVRQQVSIEFWMKPAPDNKMGDCCQGLVSANFYLIEIVVDQLNNSGIIFAINSGNGYVHTMDNNNGSFKVPMDKWSYIVGTYDGQSLRLYVNGKEEVQLYYTGRITPMPTDSFLSIGSEDGRTQQCPNCIGTRYFKGLIDEISVYNRALTNDEVQSIFIADEAGKCTSLP